MSSIDTRILGSTVAELVGVPKEHQELVLAIMQKLNSRNPDRVGVALVLEEALYPNEVYQKSLEGWLKKWFDLGKLQWVGHYDKLIESAKKGESSAIPSLGIQIIQGKISLGHIVQMTKKLSEDPYFTASQLLAFVEHELTEGIGRSFGNTTLVVVTKGETEPKNFLTFIRVGREGLSLSADTFFWGEKEHASTDENLCIVFKRTQ